MWAAHTLAWIKPAKEQIKTLTEAWIDAINDRRGKYHQAAISYCPEGLRQMEFPAPAIRELSEALVAQTGSPDEKVRRNTRRAIVRIASFDGDAKSVVTALLKAASDSEKAELRDAAFAALQEIKNQGN